VSRNSGRNMLVERDNELGKKGARRSDVVTLLKRGAGGWSDPRGGGKVTSRDDKQQQRGDKRVGIDVMREPFP